MHRLIQIAIAATFLFGLVLPMEGQSQPLRDDTQSEQADPEAPAQVFTSLTSQAAQAYSQGDYEAWVEALEKLREMRPHDPQIMAQLVSGYAEIGERSKAFNMMLIMQQQGLAHDWEANPHVESLRGERLYDHLKSLMDQALQPFGEGRVVAEIEDISMPETLAHDPETGRYFLGTVRDGQVLVSDDSMESWKVFADSEDEGYFWSVFDLAVDAERRDLWVATGVTRQYRHYQSDDRGRTALLRIDLDSGEIKSRHPMALGGQPTVLGSLALAEDGTVYAADTVNPMIVRLEPETEHPIPIFSNPELPSIRGLALSGDGSLLYLADFDLGLFVIRLTDGNAFQVAIPDELNVSGIDGLFWWEGRLVVIQSGISPQRVVRLELGPDGLGVTGIVPLEASHPAFDQPTYGTVVDDNLVYLGANHWSRVNREGEPLDGDSLPPVPVVRTALDSEKAMEVRDQEALRRALQEQQREP